MEDYKLLSLNDNYKYCIDGLPVVCNCGIPLTEEDIIWNPCKEECKICKYCGADKCKYCGSHIHCGECI